MAFCRPRVSSGPPVRLPQVDTEACFALIVVFSLGEPRVRATLVYIRERRRLYLTNWNGTKKKKILMHMRRPIFIAEVVIYVISFLQSSLMTLNKAQEQDLRHCSCSSSNTWDQTDFKGTQEFLVL